jgi:hypothetical protein
MYVADVAAQLSHVVIHEFCQEGQPDDRDEHCRRVTVGIPASIIGDLTDMCKLCTQGMLYIYLCSGDNSHD